MAGSGFVVEQAAVGDRDDASGAVDRKASPGGIVQGVGDGVGRAVGIGCGSRNSDKRPIGRVFGEGVGGSVAVGDRANVELVDVGEVDGKGLGRPAAVGGGGPDGDGVAGGRFVVE